MARKIIYPCLCLLFMLGCISRKSNNPDFSILRIDFSETSQSVRTSEIASAVQLIPLYTDDDNLIGEIRKIRYGDNCIYVSDETSLYRFAMDGSLIGKISKRGLGPGEYIGLSDFQIDADDMIWILSRNNKKLNKYGWDNEMKESISLDWWVSHICLDDNDNIYLYIGNEAENINSRLISFNLKSKQIIQEYLPIDPKQAMYLHIQTSYHFSKENNTIYFFESFNDTIYTLTEKDITPAYYLNLDNKNIPPSFFDANFNDVMEFFQALFKNSYAYSNSLFEKHGNTLISSFIYNRKKHLCVIDEEKTLMYSFLSMIEDRELGGFPVDIAELHISTHNNKLIFPLLSYKIVEYAKENLSADKTQEIIRKLNYVTEDQNPVIMIVEIK